MRHYKRKSEGGNYSAETIRNAVHAHNIEKKSLSQTADEFGIPKRTLARYCQKSREGGVGDVGYVLPRLVFTLEEEYLLTEYLKKATDIYFGLSPKEVRQFAYQYAERNGVNMPESWKTREMAGPDWFTQFLSRHPDLSLRAPQATSLARATSFNKTNVTKFFDLLQIVLSRHDFQAHDIFNMDETGITSVQRPDRVVARKGFKQVGRITSAERGNLVTMAACVSAGGTYIPPIFVFPRAKFQDRFVVNGPHGSSGDANKSGWMIESNFIKFSKHFVHFSRCSTERPVLLLLDNHDSHLSIEAIDILKDKGVTVLSFPPHCSHKLQPLDRSVFGPLKKFINSACDSWITNNPGKTLSIYDIPGIAATAFESAMTPKNIISGFRVSGIWPFNRDIFSESDYLPSLVTDRPLSLPDEGNVIRDIPCSDNMPSVSGIASEPSVSHSETPLGTPVNVTPNSSRRTVPEDIRPFPKAGPRKESNRGRKRRQMTILTDTPNRNDIATERAKRKAKVVPKKTKMVEKSKKKRRKPSTWTDSSDGLSDGDICYAESDDSQTWRPEGFSDFEEEQRERKKSSGRVSHYTSVAEIGQYLVDDFVLVKYEARSYPGTVLDIDGDEFLIKTMVKHHKNWKWPDVEDTLWYNKCKIIRKLDPPVQFSKEPIFRVDIKF